MLNSVESLAVKTPVYATLVALVKDEPEFLPLLVARTKSEMERCATEGRWRALTLLARFVAALVDMRVLQPAAVDTVFDALLALAETAAPAHADALYTACLLLFWSETLASDAAFAPHAARVVAAATDADAAVPALASALAVLRDALSAAADTSAEEKAAAWRAQQAASSFLSLHPFAPFGAASSAATDATPPPADFGALVLHAGEGDRGSGASVRAHAAVLPLCAAAPVLAPFDAVLYADCAHAALAELLDDPALCARHLTSLVPVAPRAVAAFDAHLACTLLSVLVAPRDALTPRDARLLGALLSRALHGATPAPGLAPHMRTARTALLARLATLDPRAVVRLAAWTAADICETRDTAAPASCSFWAETVVPLLGGGGEGSEGEKGEKSSGGEGETTSISSPAAQLFVATLLRECCVRDVPRAFMNGADFPRVLAARCPPADGAWPAHLRSEPASQRLLSRLATACAPAELRALVGEGGGAARVADCVVRVCAMSYLNCVYVLNAHHATLAAAVGSAALLASVRRCCGRCPHLRALLLDKMTTAGLVALGDVVDAFLAPAPAPTSDDNSDGGDKNDGDDDEVPWDVLEMVVDKCVAVHSPAGAQAVARCREYAQRVAATDAYASALAASYAAHWELLLQH